ncbi:MAG: Hsp20/alpha crystallin family protein [Sphingomonadales bacterium]|nr:Hsp20/alpha crystallin family protein [Sphingomonadales bacterium]
MANQEISRPKDAPVPRPLDAFEAMRDEMNQLFDRFDRGWLGLPEFLSRGAGAGAMRIGLDVKDEGKAIVVEAELPGVDEKDVKVTFSDGVLSVSGEKKQEREEKKDNYYLSERSFGSFSRSVRLPDSVDDSKIDARFDKGVLRITAAKKPEAVKAQRTIEIKKG